MDNSHNFYELENLTDDEILNLYNDIVYISKFGPQSGLPNPAGGYTYWYSECPSEPCNGYSCVITGYGTFRNIGHWASGCWCAYKNTPLSSAPNSYSC